MNKDFLILDFANQNIPTPYESRNTSESTYVTWGANNLYPNFLIDLYSQSAIHSAIINQKTNYIIGGGLQLNQEPLDIMVNANDSLNEFSSKIIKDYLIFNAFAVEVLFNVYNEPVEYYHIPVHKIRMNKSKTKFWYNEDWLLSRKHIQYDRYSNETNQDNTSKIFYFDGYFPSIYNVYPTPEYAGTIKSITTDIAIKEFNLNNIKNHFSPSTIITFFNGGNVPEDVKRQMISEIENNFKGESGKKFIIDFQAKDGKGSEIKQLSANNWDKAYFEISAKNTDDILIGHECQNPSLFGIKTAGQLGSSQELEVSYEILKNNYISVKRNEIQIALNQMFAKFKGINGKLSFIDRPLFNTQLKDEIKLKIYTINELRALGGLAPLPDGDKLLEQAPAVQVNNQPAQPVKQEEDVKKKSGRDLTEDDYELIKHLGTSIEDFEVIEELNNQTHKFGKEADIADYVISNDIKGLTISELVDVLETEGNIKTTSSQVQSVLDDLVKSGIANVDVEDGRIKVMPLPKPDVPESDGVSVMYKYTKRPEAKGGDLLPTSRSFCVKLIENNRLYTREDIQSMAAIFGYDIYRFAGGWWHNPETGETTSHCRHYWLPLKVKRRN